jgi:hypothetical protein
MGKQFAGMSIVPAIATHARHLHHAYILNQITTATTATTIPAHTTGEIFFELPLRGESLAAWLNSVFMT